jgi:hypothetical protein
MSKQQTAVEWLGTTLNKRLPPLDWDASAIIYKTVQKALKMEKEQIMDAFNEGIDWHRDYFGKQKGVKKILPETYGEGNE